MAAGTGLYRILQEALANVLKHAHASEVKVSLAFEPGNVRLSVEDDGVGFQPGGAGSGYGYGLQNMRERADELGGTFDISGVSGQGTTITVVLPAQEVELETRQGDDSGRPRSGALGAQGGA